MRIKNLEFELERYARGHTVVEAMINALRYEALRKLTVQQFKELCSRNLNGENFDAMVDELIK